MARAIIFAPSCDAAALVLGGYQRIDPALDAVMQGLMVNPYSFPLVESDFYRARYLRTRPIRDLPSLVWLFSIDVDNNVILQHVEEFEEY